MSSSILRTRFPLLLWLNVILLLLAAVLALVWYHEVRYMTSSVANYLQSTTAWLAALTGAVTWFSGIAWGIQYVYNRVRQQPEPRRLTREQMMHKYLPSLVDKIFLPALRSIWLMILTTAMTGLLAYEIFYVGPTTLPPGGPIIVTPTVADVPYTSHQKHVYLAIRQTEKHAGGIAVLDERAVQLKEQFIALGSIADKSEPSCIAVAPSKRKLFVTDPASARLWVIDETWNVRAVAVGWQPQCVAVSPDERKAYVTNKQPAPYGTISVIDADREVLSHTIENVNCPSGLAVSRDGRRLYVVTECGGGHDPLLVIDTATDEIIASIPDVEIGRALAVSPDGKRLFVARVNVSRPDMKPVLLSVFSTVNHDLLDETSFDTSIAAIATSSDPEGKFLFVATGPTVKIVSAYHVQKQINEIHTCGNQKDDDCVPIGLAPSDRGAIYMYLAGDSRTPGSPVARIVN